MFWPSDPPRWPSYKLTKKKSPFSYPNYLAGWPAVRTPRVPAEVSPPPPLLTSTPLLLARVSRLPPLLTSTPPQRHSLARSAAVAISGDFRVSPPLQRVVFLSSSACSSRSHIPVIVPCLSPCQFAGLYELMDGLCGDFIVICLFGWRFHCDMSRWMDCDMPSLWFHCDFPLAIWGSNCLGRVVWLGFIVICLFGFSILAPSVLVWFRVVIEHLNCSFCYRMKDAAPAVILNCMIYWFVMPLMLGLWCNCKWEAENDDKCVNFLIEFCTLNSVSFYLVGTDLLGFIWFLCNCMSKVENDWHTYEFPHKVSFCE